MKPWETLSRADIPHGGVMTLCRRDDEYVIFADRLELMSSRRHGSEERLATETLRRVPCRRLLIGGLGLGYTLRAALDALPPEAEVVVAELVPEVVAWNQTFVSHLAGHPLQDPRVEVRQADVAEALREPSAWDAILLDVDNGPNAFTQNRNDGLYQSEGLFTARLALRPGGVLTVWSSSPDRQFEQRLSQHGFQVETLQVAAYPGSRDKHTLFIARIADWPQQRRGKPSARRRR